MKKGDITSSSSHSYSTSQQYQCGATSSYCQKGKSSCALFGSTSPSRLLRSRVSRILKEIQGSQRKGTTNTKRKPQQSSSHQVHLFIDPDARLSQSKVATDTYKGEWKMSTESIISHSPVKLNCNKCTINSSIEYAMIGWRGYPHSYAVVAEGISQGLLLTGISMSFTDAPAYKPEWLKLKDEASLAGVSASKSSKSLFNVSSLEPLAHSISIQRFSSAGNIPVSPSMCIMSGMCKEEKYSVRDRMDADQDSSCPRILLRSFYPLDLSPHPCAISSTKFKIDGNIRPIVFIFGTTEFQTLADPLWIYQARTFMDASVDKSETLLISPWRNLDSSVRVIAPSKWSANGFAAAGVKSSQLIILPHGIDPNVFRPLVSGPAGILASRRERLALRTALRWTPPPNISSSEDCFTILSVGHMRFTKGLDVLLRAVLSAASELTFKKNQHLPKCLRLVLKGLDGLYGSSETIKRSLESIFMPSVTDFPSNEHMITGTRLFAALSKLGRLQLRIIGKLMAPLELVKLYQASDAYASPYRAEGFNIPVLEAAACGLPLLVTIGGATDEFTHPSFALYIKSEEVIGGKEQGMQGRSHHMEPDLNHLADLILALASQSEGLSEKVFNETGFDTTLREFTNVLELPPTWRANAGLNAVNFVIKSNLTWKGIAFRLQRFANTI
jgi:glycosyltransferase involved in cell wall biosynthesis